MIYLSGKLSPELARFGGDVGQMITPDSYRAAAFVPALPFAIDNACFSNPQAFSLGGYLRFLNEIAAEHGPALFATAPDVFGDGAETLRRSLPVLAEIRETGHPAALVLQPGTPRDLPWQAFDCAFLGGPDWWQRSEEAAVLVGAARERGLWTHKGRVNSHRRFIAAAAAGFDSADGTFLAFGIDLNLRRLSRWIGEARHSAPFVGFTS